MWHMESNIIVREAQRPRIWEHWWFHIINNQLETINELILLKYLYAIHRGNEIDRNPNFLGQPFSGTFL